MPDKDERRIGLAALEAKIDAMHDDIKQLIVRQNKHSGEGTETTHSLIDKRLRGHDQAVNRAYGIAAILGGGVAYLVAWIKGGK